MFKYENTTWRVIGCVILCVSAQVFGMLPAYSQTLPSSADPSRIDTLDQPRVSPQSITIPKSYSGISIPENTKQVSFRLNALDIKGATAFSNEALSDIYGPYMGREITLDVIWMIAGQITERYRSQGYFISRAYVPAQEIEGGRVVIEVVEGHVRDVEMDDSISEHRLVKGLVERVTSQKPLSADALESFMLLLNDIPGYTFRAIVNPLDDAELGAVKLVVKSDEAKGKGIVSVDNHGSRFLGPYQASVIYQDSFIPMQETTVSTLASVPIDELQYVSFQHEVPIRPQWYTKISGSYARTRPGAGLEVNDIRSSSVGFGVGLYYQPIRQRSENLVFSVALDGKNTNGDVLKDNPLTRDRIRAIRAKVHYDVDDRLHGYNYFDLTVSQGIGVLGASDAGDSNLSRSEANPDFTTVGLSYIRQQALPSQFFATTEFLGQYASDPLFSAEEFGYGGQRIGRAYDPSEITGDHGLAASLELRYQGFEPLFETRLVPYGFYDVGKVWNEDTGGEDISAASAGVGLRANHDSGVSFTGGLAWPLTREISDPVYGNGKNPRVLLNVNYAF